MVRPGPLSGGRCARAGLGAGAAQPGRPLGRRPAGRVCSTGCALRLVSAAHTAAPSFSPGAARSGIARGPVPSRPVIPGPAHLPWEGRSTAHALDLERTNRCPGQVRRNTQRWRQLLWSQRVGRPGRCHRSAGRQSVAKPPAGGRGGLHPFGHSCPWGSGVAAWPEAVSAESSSTAKWSPSATIMLFRHAGQGI
jgi:hypothetical protein